MSMPDKITVTMDRDEFNEVVNLLQLMTVLGIKLWVQGSQPSNPLLTKAFDTMAKAGMAAFLEKNPTPGPPSSEEEKQEGKLPCS